MSDTEHINPGGKVSLASAHAWFDLLLMNDCEPDEHLDYITREAAVVFNVPIAMINLVTSTDVIFKSCIGFQQGDMLDKNGQFCSLAVTQEAPLLIPDATKDKIFKNSPLVVGPLKIRSYLGKSLHAPDGTRIATLCLLDTKPRTYSIIQQNILCEMALQAEAQLHIILEPSRAYA